MSPEILNHFTPNSHKCSQEEEILEPLIPSVLANLEHRHSYVRRYAVMALDAIFKLPKGDHLAADAPEIIEKFLHQEQVRLRIFSKKIFFQQFNFFISSALLIHIVSYRALLSWSCPS